MKILVNEDGTSIIDMICLNCKQCQFQPIDIWMKRLCELTGKPTYISSTCDFFDVKDALRKLGYKIKEV